MVALFKRAWTKKQIELAELLGYTKGAMTKIANKLVATELVERIYDENDKRTIQLCITLKGLEALRVASKIGNELYVNLFSALTNDEIETYLTLQQKLINGLNEV